MKHASFGNENGAPVNVLVIVQDKQRNEEVGTEQDDNKNFKAKWEYREEASTLGKKRRSRIQRNC